jgi:prolyl oligopeptidase
LYVQLLDGGIGRLLRVPNGAKPEQVPLPFEDAVDVAPADPRVPGALLLMTSWIKATKVYAYDPATKQVVDTQLQPTGPHDEAANIEAEEVKIPTYDGTLVPLSIVHQKGMKLNGSNPTNVYGYGS